MAGKTSEPVAPIQSVDRAIQILQFLTDAPELSTSEIARRLGVHRSTASRILATLENRDVVEQVAERGAFRLGLGILRMAYPVSTRFDLARDGQAVCDALAETTQETTNIAILDQGHAVTITQSTGQQMVGVAGQYVGQRVPLHATSTGKLLLAHATNEVWEQVISQPLERYTDATQQELSQLADELRTIRQQGWSSAIGEWEEGINALAVPVWDATGHLVAAVSVTAPAFRMPETRFDEFLTHVQSAAKDFEARLGFSRVVPTAP
ncbi:IclR family transcriptional regulator [Enteractinococcus coprophilus]|uniref:Glycerol operon regulatory protein n=1 Tax=Enteractinococcus coprophilus TaxID=1027633 RepID=A0A543AFQ3_9MICC|nr:IclR family transcriptional regulator [Enteractinococcus coprophilus]TQL71408.1 IclR family transcriptional regulator [Enteractinococcus coprophilus]